MSKDMFVLKFLTFLFWFSPDSVYVIFFPGRGRMPHVLDVSLSVKFSDLPTFLI